MKRRSFFWQLMPWIAGLCLVLGPLATFVSYQNAKKVLLDQIQRSLLVQGRTMLPLLIERYKRSGVEGLKEPLKLKEHADVRISVVSPDGTVLSETDANHELMDNHLERPEMQQAMRGEVGSSWRFSKTVKHNYFYTAIPVELVQEDGAKELIAILRLATQVRQIDDLMRGLFNDYLRGAVLALALALLFGVLMARFLARPLERITRDLMEHQNKLEDTHLTAQENDPREIRNLVDSINAMASSLHRRTIKSRKQESELQAVFSSLTEGVLTVDTEKNIFHFNQQFEQLLRLPVGQLQKGKPVEEALPILLLQELMTDVLQGHGLVEREWKWPAPDEERYFIIKASPLLTRQGELMGALVVINDVTQMKRLESHRRDFVANVGHELRTPLTAIQGYLETIVEGKVDDKALEQKFLQKCLKQSTRLAQLVDDLFRLAQLDNDAAGDEIEKVPTDVAQVIASAMEAIQLKANRRHMHIVLEKPATTISKVTLHAGLIELAVINLLDNAIKYSPEGSTITVASGEGVFMHKNKAQSGVFIRVQDQGPGIALIHRPRIFERFYCVDKARSREMGGTGLGLALVKHIALVHGGDVEVGGEVGHGAEFTIWLMNS